MNAHTTKHVTSPIEGSSYEPINIEELIVGVLQPALQSGGDEQWVIFHSGRTSKDPPKETQNPRSLSMEKVALSKYQNEERRPFCYKFLYRYPLTYVFMFSDDIKKK